MGVATQAIVLKGWKLYVHLQTHNTNMNREQLIEEARKRGIVEGATCRSKHDHTWVVGPIEEWKPSKYDTNTLHDYSDDMKPTIYDTVWATVATPAPQQEGLKDGDAVECGPAMRAAIVELAKELGLDGRPPEPCIAGYPNLGWNGRALGDRSARDTTQKARIWHTPEVFIAKMRVTAALPKPEQPIIIDGRTLEFLPGGLVKVGCQTIEVKVLDLILERSKARR